MLKFWTLAFIGIAFFANSAHCDNEDANFWDGSMELVKNLPRYIKEAIDEVEKKEQTIAINDTHTFSPRFRNQCFNDYFRMFGALLRRETWALQGTVKLWNFP